MKVMKKYIYVYRFERDGLGCFMGNHCANPWIWGCTDKAQLKRYFGTMRITFKSLFKQGYRIKRYKVPYSEVVFLGGEVKFPIKYHKLRKVENIKKDTP